MPAGADNSWTFEAFRQLGRVLGQLALRAEERARATHSRFNVFTTLLKENDEVRLHTRFLHALLDPEGRHDCGSVFLDLFFKSLALDKPERGDMRIVPGAQEGWKAKKEAGRSRGFGQIDILLEHRCFGIGIENKIHAYEQKGQLASYASFLRSRYGENFLLIFLTLDGKESSTHGGVPYIKVSYAEHILPWLDRCLQVTYSSIPVNQMLLQYRQVVRSLTGKSLERSTMKPIVDFISVTPELIRHRGAWYKAVDDAKALILDRFANKITEVLSENLRVASDPEDDEGRFGTEWGKLYIQGLDNERILPAPFELCIENSTEDRELSLGVHAGYDKAPHSPELQAWLDRLKSEWVLDPIGAESLENKPNPAWPLGWISLWRIDDDGIADLMEPGRFDEAMTDFADRVFECVRVLRRIGSQNEAEPL